MRLAMPHPLFLCTSLIIRIFDSASASLHCFDQLSYTWTIWCI